MVRTLYKRLGIALSAETEQAFAAFLVQERQHKYGKHVYSFEQFGLIEGDVRMATRRYVKELAIEDEA